MKNLLILLLVFGVAYPTLAQRSATSTSTARKPVSVRQATSNLKLQYKDLVIDNQDSVALEVNTGNVPAALSLTVNSPSLIIPVCKACFSSSSGPKFPVTVKNSGGTDSESSFILVQLYYKKDGKSILIAETGKSAPPIAPGKSAIVEFQKSDFCAQVQKAVSSTYATQTLSYVQAKVSLVEEINFGLK
ncbi:hypothetical protein [Algoriphagus litoralis]|uniref:hypothetical protein n=1 Tax=Algoriphagus litoralis TaxID=2202829 RepID=UPI000DB92FBB|nr:hypothetical protein [Algoriphagus litoralis]